MLLSYGSFFFDFNYPTPWRGGVNKDCFPTGPFFFCTYLSLACRRGRNKYPPLPRGINIYTSR